MRIFISYSHNDEAIKDRLVKHLQVLQLANIVQDASAELLASILPERKAVILPRNI